MHERYVRYASVFKTRGYKFKLPSNNTCKTYDILELQIKQVKSSEDNEKQKTEKKSHLNKVDFAYEMTKKDKISSNETKGTRMPTPSLNLT